MFREPPFRLFSPALKILALVLVMIVVFFVVLALGVALSLPFFGTGLLDRLASVSDYSDPQTIGALKYFQIVNQVGVFILPAILFVILTDDNFRGYLSLDRRMGRFSAIMGAILLVVSMPFVSWLVEINGDIHLPSALAGLETWMRNTEEGARQVTDAFLSTDSWGGFLVNLLMIAVLAAIGEELIFRGILVRLFREWTGSMHLAVIIPALLFSALHLQFYGFFGRFLLGALLGYLFVFTGSLWVPIFVHFLNNALAVTLSFLDARGVVEVNLDTFGSSQNVVVIAGSFFLMVFSLGMVWFHQRRGFRKRS